MESPSRSARDERFLRYLSLALLLVASLLPVMAAGRLAHPVDDAYITMNYARSIAEGRGVVFGHTPHPTYGSTTPLNMLLLAALYRLLPQVDKVQIAVGISAAAWIMLGWLWYWQGVVFGLRRRERTLIALLILTDTSLWVAFLGMETRLFVLLLTLALIVYRRGYWVWAGILTGLLFLTRGEGILLLVALLLHQAFIARRAKHESARSALWAASGRLLLGFAAAALPWVLYALWTFGSPVPTTLAAKSIQMQMGFTQPFVVYLGWLFVGEWNSLGFIGGSSGVSIWALLFLAGLAYSARKRRIMLLFPAWMFLFVMGYFLLNIPTYKWYALPVVYVVTILAGLTLSSIADWSGDVISRRRLRYRDRARLGMLAVEVIVLGLVLLPGQIPGKPVDDERHNIYQALAGWLETHTPAASRIGYIEIGYLGWYSSREIVDLMGLTNPELITPLKNRDFVTAFRLADVDYLICASQFAWACRDIITDSDFMEHYTPFAMLKAADLDPHNQSGQTYTVFRRGSRHPAALLS